MLYKESTTGRCVVCGVACRFAMCDRHYYGELTSLPEPEPSASSLQSVAPADSGVGLPVAVDGVRRFS